MFRAALKSLLGRKVRLLMSTFAIVLGVAFVVGSLIFTDTLSRSFTALFASTVGDVVVRPGRGRRPTPHRLAPSPRRWSRSSRASPAPPGSTATSTPSASSSSARTARSSAASARPPSGATGPTPRPATASRASRSSAAASRRGPDEVLLDDDHRRARRATPSASEVHLVTGGAQAVLRPTLVGIAGFPEGGSLNGATLRGLRHRVPRRSCSSAGEDAFTDIWVTAEPGTSQEDLARPRDRGSSPTASRRSPATRRPTRRRRALQEAIGFLTDLPADLRRHLAGRRRLPHRQHVLDPGRAAQPRAGAAAGARGVASARSPGRCMLEAFVLGAARLHDRPRPGRPARDGHPQRSSRQFGLDLSGQSLIFAPRTVLAAYAVGIVVTMAAAWLPARRTGRIAPIQAMRDDVAMPESSLHRRLVVGVAMILAGGAALAAGLMGVVPRGRLVRRRRHPGILLGVAAASPVISHPFLAAAAWLYARLFGTVGRLAGQNSLRNPRRTTATSSALMIGLSLACTMAIVGDSAKASVDQTIEENFVGDYVVSIALRAGLLAADRPRHGAGRRRRARLGAALRHHRRGGDAQGVAAARPGGLRAGHRPRPWSAGDAADLRDGTVIARRGVRRGGGAGGGRRPRHPSWPTGSTSSRWSGIYAENPILFFPIRHHAADPRSTAGYRDADNFLIIDTDGSAGGAGRASRAVVAELPIVTVKDQQEFAAGAAGADRPAGADDLRAARPGPADRRARHRQHAGAVDHRAHARGRACCGRSASAVRSCGGW